jgi:hypothetical protein
LLNCIMAHRTEAPEVIVRAALQEAESFGVQPTDDRTLLIMRI